jgi:hypothetical protein
VVQVEEVTDLLIAQLMDLLELLIQEAAVVVITQLELLGLVAQE